MSLLPFLLVAFGAGTMSLLTRQRADISGGIGIAGLALAALAGATALVLERVGGPLGWGGGAPLTDVATILVLGTLGGLLMVLAGAGPGTVPRSLPGATLMTLGWAGLALAVGTPQAALVLATAAGATSLLPMLDTGAASDRGAVGAAVVLRVTVGAGIVAAIAAAVLTLGPPADGAIPVRIDDAVVGLALLAVAGAVAARLGVIPFHRAATRLASAAPPSALPLALIWGPVVFALVAVTWLAPSPIDADLAVERGIILVCGLAGVLLGTAAALIHDDLEHVLGYAIATDGGIALLAIGAPAEPVGAAAWTWLLAVAVGRTALAGWVVAVGGRSGSRRLGDLAGWARRSPALAMAFAGATVAAIGWPGSAVFTSRATLASAPLDASFAPAALAIVLAPSLIFVRLLVIGLRRPVPAVRDVPGEARTRLRVATVAALVLAGLGLAVSGGLVGVRGPEPLLLGGEDPAVDLSVIVDQLVGAEPEGHLGVGSLRPIGRVDQVLGGLDREVSADRPGRRLVRTRRAVHRADH